MLFNKEIYNAVQKELYNFQKEYDVKIIIASLGGSLSIGTSNMLSDLDIYVIYDDKNKTLPCKIKFQSEYSNIELHIISCGKNRILDSLNLFDTKYEKRKYPTYLYRTKSEIEMNHKLTMYEREDYPRTLIFYTLVGNEIWFFDESLEDVYKLFKKGLRVIDALDFYYTKTIGNYEHFIKGKNQISARKYITVIQEILYCRYMLEKKTVPPMDLKKLLNIYRHEFSKEELKDFDRAYCMNQDSKKSKEQNLLEIPDSLIIYTKKWLGILRDKFRDVDGYYFNIKDMEKYSYEKN